MPLETRLNVVYGPHGEQRRAARYIAERTGQPVDPAAPVPLRLIVEDPGFDPARFDSLRYHVDSVHSTHALWLAWTHEIRRRVPMASDARNAQRLAGVAARRQAETPTLLDRLRRWWSPPSLSETLRDRLVAAERARAAEEAAVSREREAQRADLLALIAEADAFLASEADREEK